jgi:hypothetical protein
MLDAGALIRKHKANGVLVDANLLVLLFVGLVNTGRIRNFKRTSDFTVEDFQLLLSLIDWFGAPLVTTPYVLSQVSDLTDLPGEERASIRALFMAKIELIEEHYDPGRQLVKNPVFQRHGLADASIAAVCKRRILVLTADLQLQVALGSLGLEALDFNHVRALNW